MLDIEKARIIRDEILRSDFLLQAAEVTWGRSVVDGVEHLCWRVVGDGWTATVSTLWDMMAAGDRAPGLEEGDRYELIRRHVLEVYAEGQETMVVGLSYSEDDAEDHLFAFTPGSWERRFAFRMSSSELDRSAGKPQTFRAPGSGLRTSSPLQAAHTPRTRWLERQSPPRPANPANPGSRPRGRRRRSAPCAQEPST